MKNQIIILLLINLLVFSCKQQVEFKTNVFVSGTDGYHTYRIPAIIETNKGTLLAFCEGRKGSRSDAGDIDLLLKRSSDYGQTWSEQIIIWNDAENTCGNPSPILDRETGKVHLLMTWNRGDDSEKAIINGESKDKRRVFITSSDDDGLSWAEPKEITSDVKLANWTWYATGPGAGIQIERGKYSGRLVVPCDHIEAETKHYYSHTIFSDDGGVSWELGGSTEQHEVNECQVVEISRDRLILNMRNYNKSNRTRQIAYSNNGGESWYDQKFAHQLIEPICQASFRAVGWNDDGKRKHLYFTNPADTSSRVRLTLKVSDDEGNSWKPIKVIHPGPSAYSDIVEIDDTIIGCVYESGKESPYETISFAKIAVEGFLTD